MENESLCELLEAGDLEDLGVREIHVTDGHVAIDGRIPVPVACVNSSIEQDSDIEIFDESGEFMGMLCFASRITGKSIHELSVYQQAAVLRDISALSADDLLISCDYVVLAEQKFAKYVSDYKEGAPIWGGFLHIDESPPKHSKRISSIIAYPSLRVPTDHHRRALRLAIRAAHPFDRFLKLYHQLELLFDWVVVMEIKRLKSDLQGYATLLSDYSAQDLPRLKDLCIRFVNDVPALTRVVAPFVKYLPKAKILFYDYGKAGNPLNSDEKWDRFERACAGGTLTFEDAKTEKVASKEADFSDLCKKVAAYWIFRIRCSAAHSRIGEYILTDDDEEFVTEFGEPLLVEVLMQVLSAPEFKDLQEQ